MCRNLATPLPSIPTQRTGFPTEKAHILDMGLYSTVQGRAAPSGGPHMSADKSFPPPPRVPAKHAYIRKSVQCSPIRLLHVRFEEVGRLVAGHRRGRRHLDLFNGGKKLRRSAGYSRSRSRSRCGCAGDEGLGARRRGGEEEQSRERLISDNHAGRAKANWLLIWTKPKDMPFLFRFGERVEDFDENENAKISGDG